MNNSALIESYHTFMATAQPFVSITNESEYNDALVELEQVLEAATDTLNDPFNPLIDMLSHAIEQYEYQDGSLLSFIKESEEQSVDLALLRSLMSHHKLTGSDLPEIGDKTMVSKILNGKRSLNRSAIEKLSSRFGLRPIMFFDESD